MPESSDFKAFPHRGIEYPPVLRDFFDVSGVVALLFGQFGTNTPHRFKPTIRGAARKKRMNRRRLSAFCKKEKAMNKLELVEQVASETETSKAAAAAAVDAVLDAITNALKKGDEVRLVGFGTFSVKQRAESKGRNPATGAEITIPASTNARFKPGATLKNALNK
jgi:DNA-binding protein HU-beta